MTEEQLTGQGNSQALLRAAACQSQTQFKCWYCPKWVPKGQERIIEEPGREDSYYVKGAEGLAISCGCQTLER